MRKLVVRIPRNYMNCGITTKNNFIADTNDSANWGRLFFPLPKGKWSIHHYYHDDSSRIVTLIDRRNWIVRLLKL